MWAVAVYDLGLSTEQFFQLNLRKFNALVERFESEQERADFRAAQICSVAANIMGKKEDGTPFGPGDFFPSLRSVDGTNRREMSGEEIMNGLLMLYPRDNPH